MKTERNQTKLQVFIKRLMPNKSEEELKKAEDRFVSYLKLLRDIQQRIESEKEQNT